MGGILFCGIVFLTRAVFSFDLERYLPVYLRRIPELSYNLLLKDHTRLSEKDRKKTLSLISTDPPKWYEWPSLELIWDTLMLYSGSREEAYTVYRAAYLYTPIPRIAEKIDILSGSGSIPSRGIEPLKSISTSGNTYTGSYSRWEISSLSEALDRIKKDGLSRGLYLAPTGSDQSKNILRDTIDFLSTDREIVDW